MSSAANAIEIATYALLTESGPIGAAVYQHVPEDTPPPVVIIGDIETRPLGTKDEKDRIASLTILTVTEAEERAPALAIMQKIEDRLDGATRTIGGWNLSFSFDGDDTTLTPDGGGYVGTSRFTIMALVA